MYTLALLHIQAGMIPRARGLEPRPNLQLGSRCRMSNTDEFETACRCTCQCKRTATKVVCIYTRTCGFGCDGVERKVGSNEARCAACVAVVA